MGKGSRLRPANGGLPRSAASRGTWVPSGRSPGSWVGSMTPGGSPSRRARRRTTTPCSGFVIRPPPTVAGAAPDSPLGAAVPVFPFHPAAARAGHLRSLVL